MIRAFYLLAGECGGINRFYDETLDFFILLFEKLRNAGVSAARADEVTKAVDPAFGLLPDLRAGAEVMCFDIASSLELIRAKCIAVPGDALRFFLDEFEVGAADFADF